MFAGSKKLPHHQLTFVQNKKPTVIVTITLLKTVQFYSPVFALRSLLQGENTASIDGIRKQSIRTSLMTS